MTINIYSIVQLLSAHATMVDSLIITMDSCVPQKVINWHVTKSKSVHDLTTQCVAVIIPPCGFGQRIRVAHRNMSDPLEQCLSSEALL